jgi:hypothetical protein
LFVIRHFAITYEIDEVQDLRSSGNAMSEATLIDNFSHLFWMNWGYSCHPPLISRLSQTLGVVVGRGRHGRSPYLRAVAVVVAVVAVVGGDDGVVVADVA